jgi:hypothetical protein
MTPHVWFVFLLHSNSRAVAVSVDASPCSKSGFLLVTLSIQNTITSWNNFGRWQGWFECRKGPTVCADRNPKMWLANGSTANLTFVYEPDFLNLGTGMGDYRMRFLGTSTAVNAALQQLQIRGSSLGSNILKIEVEDRPAAFAYAVRFDEFWNPKSLFRTEIGMSVEQAQLACKYVAAHTPPPPPCPASARHALHLSQSELAWGRRCYGFQFLPTQAYNQAVAQGNTVPSVGSPMTNLQGVLPNVFFYSPTVDVTRTSSYVCVAPLMHPCTRLVTAGAGPTP